MISDEAPTADATFGIRPDENRPLYRIESVSAMASGVDTRLGAHAHPAASPLVHVLVVDDHEIVRRGIRDMLESSDEPIVVYEAPDGEAAIRQIADLSPDVVLLDIHTPKLDGLRTLLKMRDLGLESRVILMSVEDKDDVILEGLRTGAFGHIRKDLGQSDLLDAIRTVNSGGHVIHPRLTPRLIERLRDNTEFRPTNREIEVLQLIASGLRNKEIAEQLFLSVRTVRYHTENLYGKLGVQSRTHAVRIANERGLLEL